MTGLWVGGFFISSFCITVSKPRPQSCWTKKQRTPQDLFFSNENQVVSVCVGFTSTFFFFFPPPEKSRLIRSQWGTQACPPTCRLYCVMVRECCVISLFQFTQVAQKKNINQFIKKKKKENIHQTPQKSNINMKWDNSVLPWLIIWKRAALNPPEK